MSAIDENETIHLISKVSTLMSESNEECIPLNEETNDTVERSPSTSIPIINTSSNLLNQSLSATEPSVTFIHKRKTSRLKEVDSYDRSSPSSISSTSKMKPNFEAISSIFPSENDQERKRRRCGGAFNAWCDDDKGFWKGTMQIMNVLARIVLWGSIAAMAAGCVWYSRELAYNG